MKKPILFFLLAFISLSLMAAAPAAAGPEATLWDALFNTTLLGQAHPAFAAAGIMNIIAGVMALILLLVFFRDILRTGWAVLGAIMLPLIFTILPGVLAVLPDPLGPILTGLFIIGFIGLLLWALVDWWQNRGKKEVRVTAFSRQVRIEPRCIYCKKLTTDVQELREEEETQDGDTRSYYKAVLPYPAHDECDQKNKTKDRLINWVLIGAISLMTLMAIIQAVVVLTTPIDAVSLDTPLTGALTGLIAEQGNLVTGVFSANLLLMLVTLAVNGLCFGFEKTRDKVIKYINKHTV